jgi:exodeoxyribonuclease VII large subunit
MRRAPPDSRRRRFPRRVGGARWQVGWAILPILPTWGSKAAWTCSKTPPRPRQQPEYTVSELSGAVKRVIEGEFGLVRVRGEVGRVSAAGLGASVLRPQGRPQRDCRDQLEGQVARMQVRPEEGMEVVATGRMTTFPGQSKYQLIVEDVAPAGAGALMAMLEKRRAALAGRGAVRPARKKPIPYLPG